MLPEGQGFAETALAGTSRQGTRLQLPADFAAAHFALRFADASNTVETVLGEECSWGSIQTRGKGLEVEQQPVLPLKKIGLTGSNIVLGVHRLDGQAMAEQATTHLRQPMAQLKTAVAQARPSSKAPRAGRARQGRISLSSDLFPDQPFSGQRYSLVSKRHTLSRNEIRHLTVQAKPGQPRLGVALADNPDDMRIFWNGEAAGPLDAGPELAKALSLLLRDQEAGTDPVDVALVVVSDQPCTFQFKQFQLPYQWELPLIDAKQEFRFDGRTIQRHKVALNLPEGRTVSTAYLEIDTGLGKSTAQDPTTHIKTGLQLRADRWTGTRLEEARNGRIVGVSLPLAVRGNVSLSVELRLDVQGQPTGALLAETTIELDPTLKAHNIPFGKTAMLNGVTCWLLLRPAGSDIVWEAEQVTGQSASFQGVDQPTRRQEVNRHTDRKGLFHFIQPVAKGNTPLVVYLDSEKLDPRPAQNGRYRYPLDGALALNPPHQTALSLESGSKGRVTLYPTTYRVNPEE